MRNREATFFRHAPTTGCNVTWLQGAEAFNYVFLRAEQVCITPMLLGISWALRIVCVCYSAQYKVFHNFADFFTPFVWIMDTPKVVYLNKSSFGNFDHNNLCSSTKSRFCRFRKQSTNDLSDPFRTPNLYSWNFNFTTPLSSLYK